VGTATQFGHWSRPRGWRPEGDDMGPTNGSGPWGAGSCRDAGPFPGPALPRAYRRTPDLARDMAECLLAARRHGAHLTADDAYWLAVLRRRYRSGEWREHGAA